MKLDLIWVISLISCWALISIFWCYEESFPSLEVCVVWLFIFFKVFRFSSFGDCSFCITREIWPFSSFFFSSKVETIIWKQIIRVIDATFAVAKRKLETLDLCDTGATSNPVQAWIFFRLSFRNCKICIYNCDDLLSSNSSPRSSHTLFSYIHNLKVKTILYSARRDTHQ